MFYEDVKVEKGETVSGLVEAYGHPFKSWEKIWKDGKNAALVAKRGKPERLQVGDILYIPIPWTVTSQKLDVEAHGVGFTASRDGLNGKRLSWTQTVFQDNQPVAGTDPFCVDACPPDDNLPFYYTNAELASDATFRKTFIDHPSRPNPSAAAGVTKWRAVVSLAVVTGQRVTVYNSIVWGFNIDSAGKVAKVGPRAALPNEVAGHLKLLGNGKGTGPDSFGKQGWTFRNPPAS